MSVSGLLLAAGAGRRLGGPKALARDADGTSWLLRSLAVLREGGCDGVTVVLGAGADGARALLDGDPAEVVVAEDWDEGMGASLRAGLAVTRPREVEALVVLLVDLPDVGADVVRRVASVATGPDSLVRAAYDGVPGHPVVLGRDHWPGVRQSAAGDRGARDYLARHHALLVECGDLATGRDVDSPE